MLTGKRFALRKEAKISVRLQLGPCVDVHEQESKFFRFQKKKKGEREREREGNDNDGCFASVARNQISGGHSAFSRTLKKNEKNEKDNLSLSRTIETRLDISRDWWNDF